MESSPPSPYRDSPPLSPIKSPTNPSATPLLTSKPLPPIPGSASTTRRQDEEEPYQDLATLTTRPITASIQALSISPRGRPPGYRYPNFQPSTVTTSTITRPPVYFPPYTDEEQSSQDDDDVPLAQLNLHLYRTLSPFPTEAPPAYNLVVRESFRDTLVSHLPWNAQVPAGAGGILDEEIGVEQQWEEEIEPTSRKVEKWVALGIVVVMALVVFGVAVWQLVEIRGLP
ncbi:hypothetical protein GQ43DRAFT_479566 [Delitschia confertaspora ATCC 74209]|uniref:Uncharacterized protein n=1 Tax=Delitschia confertaspora ATCC 74209 TaxID=1513339 RepID=A0A9P4JTA4_9PLEO|nr:hypothetical protein GQ43DRAFT_479566 [Delitschia confertaspora ATCC 74209]